MEILIPATGSYNVKVKYEIEEGYVCVGSKGGHQLCCRADCGTLTGENVPEMIVPSDVVWEAVEHNAEKVLDKLAGTLYIPNRD